MRHLYECPMRWADMDLLGHVNNVVYVDYLQEARVDMLRTHGPAVQTGELAEGVVVVRHEVHYRAPLTFRFKPVLIECWVTEIRAASFTMAYEVFQETDEGRRVYLRATTVLTPYVFSAESPRRLRDEEKQALAQFLEPVDRVPRVGFSEPRRGRLNHYPVHVRFSDVDVYGHVNNVKYFEYFQEARILYTARLWRDVPQDRGRIATVVAQTDVDYKVPILFRPEPYDGWTWLSHVGNRSMVVESEICDGDTVLSRSRVAMVFFDEKTERAVAPPQEFLQPLLDAVG